MKPALSEAEIARRLPLWIALADLYLDTDPMLQVDHIARTIVTHGFTLEEAEAILREDVRPGFYTNLLQVAGEWAMWTEEEVRTRILAARGRRWHGWYLGKDGMMPTEAWSAVVAEVKRLRG